LWITLESEDKEMKKTFEEIINLDMDYTTHKYVDSYNRLNELIENAEIEKAKIYLSVLKAREKNLVGLLEYVLEMERKMLAKDIGVKEGEY
jgi:hypothetical protein